MPQLRLFRPTLRTEVAAEFEDLAQFAVLAAELNFRRAATLLGVKQPTLTRRVKRIERELGAYLLERHPRRLRLTPAGERFAEHSHRLLTGRQQLQKDVVEAATGHRGPLSVGFLTALASPILLPILATYADSPDIRLELMEGTPQRQLQHLRGGQLDLALIIGPVLEPDLNAEVLWIERLIVVLPAGHRLADATSVDWSGLADECVIARCAEHDQSVARFIEERAARFGGFHPRTVAFSTSRENLVALVQAGHGITLLPDSSLRSLNTAGVRCIPLSGPGSTIEVTAAWLPENANPILRRFLEQITEASTRAPGPETPDPLA